MINHKKIKSMGIKPERVRALITEIKSQSADIDSFKGKMRMMISKQDRAKLIKEFEGRNSFGNKNALVRIRSRYTIAVWIPQQQNWMAGDGHAPTPEGAVQCADYDTLMLFKTQKETMFKAYLFGVMK